LLTGPASYPIAWSSGTHYTYARTVPVFVIANAGGSEALYQLAATAFGSGNAPPTGATSNTWWTYINPATGNATGSGNGNNTAVTIPAGNDSSLTMSNGGNAAGGSGAWAANTVYVFVTGTHTLGTTAFGQINPNTGDTILGEPGAIIDGQGDNHTFSDNDGSATGGTSNNVVMEYLTVENFIPGNNAEAMNADENPHMTMNYNTVEDTGTIATPGGAGMGLGPNDSATENCLIDNTQYGFSAGAPSFGGGGINFTNNEVGFNDATGDYDQGTFTTSFSVASGSGGCTPQCATVNLKTAINMQVGNKLTVGFTGWTSGAMSNATLDGTQTIVTLPGSGTGTCTSAGRWLCTSFTFGTSATVTGSTPDTTGVVASGVTPICGCSGGGKYFVIENGATFTGNYVHDNGYAGFWPDTDNAGFTMDGNYFSRNWADGILYEASYNAQIDNNTFVDNSWGLGPSPATGGVISGGIYLPSSGSQSLYVGSGANSSNLYSSELDIEHNTFVDNWSGISEYENGDRSCAFQNDQICPLTGNPATYTVGYASNPSAGCIGGIANESFTFGGSNAASYCRWSAANIKVEHNTFNWTAANIPNCTTSLSTSNYCGFNGLFAATGNTSTTLAGGGGWVECTGSSATPGNELCPGQVGGGAPNTAFPGCPSSCDPSPYTGNVIPNSISNNQGNVWADNTYCAGSGAWQFQGFVQGSNAITSNGGLMTKAQWTAGVANAAGSGDAFPAEDAGSTFATGSCAVVPRR
jgi:parallel beta-helix repeat protein